MNDIIRRKPDENYDDYRVRLFDNKTEYKITCQTIANLLNHENGRDWGESAYRKEYAAFNRGRKYERMKSSVGISTRILSVSDIHFPFHLPIETFGSYRGITDILVLNGDLLDCSSISSFPKLYRSDLVDDMIGLRSYLIDLINYISPKRVVVNYGNHEIRLQTYLSKSVGTDMQRLIPPTPLDYIVREGFKDYDKQNHTTIWYEPIKDVFGEVEVEYSDKWWCKIGKTIFAHPKAYSSSILKTVDKAVNHFIRFDRDFDCMCLAHTHKIGHYPSGDIVMYEQGCCADISKFTYGDGELSMPQQQGFIYICQDSEGKLIVDKSKLIMIKSMGGDIS